MLQYATKQQCLRHSGKRLTLPCDVLNSEYMTSVPTAGSKARNTIARNTSFRKQNLIFSGFLANLLIMCYWVLSIQKPMQSGIRGDCIFFHSLLLIYVHRYFLSDTINKLLNKCFPDVFTNYLHCQQVTS